MALPDTWAPIIDSAAQQYHLDPNLLRAQLLTESGGNADAVSDAGAEGPAQLMPATAKSLGVTDPDDPKQAIPAQAKLMRQNLDRYGDMATALMAYHGGPNQKNWGPLTRAYPGKVLGTYHQLQGQPMDTSFTTQPIGPNGANPNFVLMPDQGDGRGPFYFNAVTGQIIPASTPSRPGDSAIPGQNFAPASDSSGPTLDTSNYPAFGNARFQTATNMQQPQAQPQQPQQASAAQPPEGLFGMPFPSGNIFSDPLYGQQAKLDFAAGLAGSDPVNFGGMSRALGNVANAYGQRINNYAMLARMGLMFGTPLARMVQAGVPLNTARAAMGLPPTSVPGADYSAKPAAPDLQKLTGDSYDGIRTIRTSNATLDQLQQKLQSGEFSLNPAKVLWYKTQALLGNPLHDQSVVDWQQLNAAVANLTGEKLAAQSGVQTDKDAELARDALVGGGLTSNDQAIQHFNYIKNLGQLEELGIRNKLGQAYKNARQPPPNYLALEQSLPGHAPRYDAKTISSDMYGDHYSVGQSNTGVGQSGVTSRGTKYTIIGQ